MLRDRICGRRVSGSYPRNDVFAQGTYAKVDYPQNRSIR